MQKLWYVIGKREIASCKNIFALMLALIFLVRSLVFSSVIYTFEENLYRIERFLSQLHSPMHARVIIIILFMDHKATILAFRSQGVNLKKAC